MSCPSSKPSACLLLSFYLSHSYPFFVIISVRTKSGKQLITRLTGQKEQRSVPDNNTFSGTKEKNHDKDRSNKPSFYEERDMYHSKLVTFPVIYPLDWPVSAMIPGEGIMP
ncbi:hypothetical protein DUI87_08002 [Hirundo rustica rustica]|uniref:Uncharacterized protein n=1 Tax=Hirundo rustica rustica TaxID=333673 RepID=A0A3M0KRB7_HIRRU|nr:hypothetical protein DUI87_08002 [Hirundo rustica rustica]